MRVFTFILLSIFFSLKTFSQDDTTKYSKYPNTYGLQYPRLWATKVLRVPTDTVYGKNGIAILNNHIFFGNNLIWKEIDGAAIDTSYFLHGYDTVYLSYRINQKLNKSDTIYFLHQSDIANLATTSSVNAALGLKVSNTDTSTMLTNYQRKGDSATYYTKYRSDTSRTNIYNAINSKGSGTVTSVSANSPLASSGGNTPTISADTGRAAAQLATGGMLNKVRDSLLAIDNNKVNYSDSSTYYYTKYRSDTSRNNIYLTLNGKLNKSDSTTYYPYASNPKGYLTSYTVDSTIWQTKYRSDTSRANIYTALNTKGRVDSIRLVNSGTIYTSPATFSLSGNTGIVTQTLATQSPYTVFGRGSGSGTPSFLTLDSNYFAGGWRAAVSGAMLSYANSWTGVNTYSNVANLFNTSGSGSYTYLSTSASSIDYPFALDKTGFGTDVSVGAGLGLKFRHRYSSGTWSYDYLQNVVYDNGGSTSKTGFEFYTHQTQTGTSASQLAMKLIGTNLLIGTSTDDGVNKLQVNGSAKASQYRLSSLNTAPSSSSDAGTTGEIRITATYIYICIATNTWVRAALSTF